ncbi:MAG: hypothetical protein ACRDDX_14940 [Cellulosilyticaceae bacterium]
MLTLHHPIDIRNEDKELNYFELSVCKEQGVLFEECEYAENGTEQFDAKDYIEKFMLSDIAHDMDGTVSTYHAGATQVEYAFLNECENKGILLKPFRTKHIYSEILYWMGYIYRYWAWKYGETSADIYKQANFDKMVVSYDGLHCLAPEHAIKKLKNS